PLNGKLFCPDCDRPMVLGGTMPGKKTLAKRKKAKRGHCFVCGTYRKSIRKQCYPNTVSFSLLDRATDELLANVSERIELVQSGDIKAFSDAAWLKQTELGQQLLAVIETCVNGDPGLLPHQQKGFNQVYKKMVIESEEPLNAEVIDAFSKAF